MQDIPQNIAKIKAKLEEMLFDSKIDFIEVVTLPLGKNWSFTVMTPPDSAKISPVWFQGIPVSFDRGHKVLSKREIHL